MSMLVPMIMKLFSPADDVHERILRALMGKRPLYASSLFETYFLLGVSLFLGFYFGSIAQPSSYAWWLFQICAFDCFWI